MKTFNLRKYLTEGRINENEENRDWEQSEEGGFEKFRDIVKKILGDLNVDIRDFEVFDTIEGIIEFWAGEAHDNFYNHTQEDMVYLSKESGLDFGDREALFNTDEIQHLEQGALDENDEEDEEYESSWCGICDEPRGLTSDNPYGTSQCS